MPRPTLILLAVCLALLAGCAAAPPVPGGSGAPFNVLGREDAPVTMVEFSDLQCPYCARHALQTFPKLRREYIETGKLRYEARDLPLPRHAFAIPAAVAARCAGEQGQFWEFRDALFTARGRLAQEPYLEIAHASGLDVARFEACRQDGRQAENVRADAAYAASQGMASTPSFLIGRMVDGRFRAEPLVGARPYEAFAEKIDALLANPAP